MKDAMTTEKKRRRRRRRRETLREITEHARGALEYRNATTTTTARVEEKTKENAERPGWTNADWQRAFDALFLDDAETFKEVGMQDDLLFYAPRFSSGSAEEDNNNNNNNNNESNGAKDVIFVRRWKKKDTKSDDAAASEKKTSDTRTKMDLTTETVDWRATTLLNIVQHTTYSAEVSVCLLDELERKSSNSSKTEQQQRQRGTLSNPLASCKIKVFASTSKTTQSNKLKSDRRESTLPEVAFDSYYANSEEWEKCALTKDGDCLCVRLFATGGVLKFHDDEDTESNVDTENDDVGKKIIVFSGFAPRTDVARAYNAERKAACKQAFTFRAFANSTFGFDLPKLHNNNNNRRINNGSNSTNSYGVVAENGLYDDRYQANCGTHGNHSDDDDDNNVEADHLDGDIPDTSNHDDDDDGNHGNSGGGGGRRKYDFSPDRQHPKSFASPSRGGAGETDAVVTLGRGTEEEGEAVVAVSAERLHFSPLSSTKRGRDDFSASGGSGVNSDDASSAYDTDDSPSSSNLSGTPSQKMNNNNRKGGVRRLLNFGRKVETVTEEIADSSSLSSPRDASRESDVTRLRCRLLTVKVHWRALARDLLYKEWR